jgi:hypothetical protein
VRAFNAIGVARVFGGAVKGCATKELEESPFFGGLLLIFRVG